jgi:hypothetical protein
VYYILRELGYVSDDLFVSFRVVYLYQWIVVGNPCFIRLVYSELPLLRRFGRLCRRC